MSDTPFRENVIIITGASQGIGREMALQLADQGAWLSLAARTTEALEDVAKLCRERGAKALVVPTDVCDEAQCKHLIEQTVAEYGRLDTLINNAGTTMVSRVDEMPDFKLMEQVMQVNHFGSVYCTYYAIPHLKKTRGRIVAIASLLGKVAAPTRSAYAASKHAMAGFFDCLRMELVEDGVSVTVIYPGFVATGIRIKAVDADGQATENSIQEDKVMTSVECVRLVLPVIAQRKRQLVMTARGRIVQWLKLIAPEMVDNIALSAFKKGR